MQTPRYRVVPCASGFRVEHFSQVGGWWPIAVVGDQLVADLIVAELQRVP